MTGLGGNASHCGPLQADLYDLYVQYKQDTRAVIGWLISHGTVEQRNSRALSINDLFNLSQAACAKKVEMPDTVGFLFRKVIEARQQLSNFFRTSSADGHLDKDTQNHEHFTGRYGIESSSCSCRDTHTRLQLDCHVQRLVQMLCQAKGQVYEN